MSLSSSSSHDKIQKTTADICYIYYLNQCFFRRICVPVTVPTLNSRHVGIARLKSNVNLGPHAEEIRFFILVLCPSDVKVTKTSLETARTFGTLFSDLSLRHNLMTSNTVTEFKAHILVTSNEFANHQGTIHILRM